MSSMDGLFAPDAASDVMDNLDETTAQDVVELANNIAASNEDADLAAIADGVLAGAVHYWLFANKPCGNQRCDNCATISTPEGRMAALKLKLGEFAEGSDYYHSPDDILAGRA